MTLIYIMLAVMLTTQIMEFVVIYIQNSRISDLEDNIADLKEEMDWLRSRQRVNEKRFRKIGQPSDTIEIIYRPDDSGAPKYPHSDGL